MPRQKKYPDELLDRGARLVFESGRPITHVARDLGINSEILRRWVRQAEADTGRRTELLSSEERERLKVLERENRELRRANEILKSASAFFAAELDPHRTKCAYGYRRTWIALQREGEEIGRGRVQRLMRTAGIQGAKRRGKAWRTTKPDPLAHRRPDLVERDFSAEAPNRLWVSDLSYLRSWEGNLFFAFVIDAFSRKIVGWQLAPHMRTDLVLDALRMALGQREPGADFALVHHTDRGSQYTSADYPRNSTTTASSPRSAPSAAHTTVMMPRPSCRV